MKVPAPVAVLLIALSLLVVGAILYFQVSSLDGPEPPPLISPKLPYQTEEAWMVSEVTQTLSDLIAFGAGKKTKPVRVKETSEDGVYEVRSSLGEFSLDVRSGIWNPSTYSPLATKAVASTGECDENPPSALMNLLEPGFQNLAEENRRISDWLTREPGSAPAHVQAALLLGSIGLNDHAGLFRDPRQVLNRMTAHLALARALGISESDDSFLVASALLKTLTGNQSEAVSLIETWPEKEALTPWKNLLLLRNTNDWRLVEEIDATTPAALRNEAVRARVVAITPGAALDFLRKNEIEPDATIWRIFNEANLGVELGHVFNKPILDVEFSESAIAAKHFDIPVEEDNADWVLKYLNTPAAGVVRKTRNGPAIEVAGQDIFADYHQRHLLAGFSKLFSFLQDMWGVRDQAGQLKNYVLNEMPDLRLKPFLIRDIARSDAERHAANPAGEAVIFKAPETVTPLMWAALRRNQQKQDVTPAPDFHGWFSPEVPRQTAFETGERLYAIGVGDESDSAWLGELWQRAPYDYPLSAFNAYLEQGQSWTIPAPVLEKWFARVLPYNIPAMQRRADALQSDPEAFAAAMEKVIRFAPNTLLDVACVAGSHGRDDLREEYLLRAFAEAEDRVWMANESTWLVARLYTTGRVEKAREVADAAAEVYSYRGLESALWLAEAQGRWGEAMEIAKKIDQRYNEDPCEQVACYLRMNQQAPMQSAAFHGMEKKLFPKGLKKAALSDFTGPPTNGTRIDSNSTKLQNFGLVPGQIIVGLDGYKVDSMPQYQAIRRLRSDDEMTIIAWDGQSYREITGSVPRRFFDVDMTTYPR